MYLTLRIGGDPLYAIADWVVARRTDRGYERLDYRPSWRTVLRRLILSLICSGLLVVMVMTFGLPPTAGRHVASAATGSGGAATNRDTMADADKYMQDLRSRVPAEEWMKIEQRVDQLRTKRLEQQERHDSRYRAATLLGRALYWIAFGLLALVAILAPAPWQRVIVANDLGQGVRVTTISLWPRTRVCPPGSVTAVSIVAREWWHKGRFRPTFLGWRWEVRIHGVDPRTGRSLTLEFWPDLQPNLPGDLLEMTPRVCDFVDTIECITGVRPSLPVVQRSHYGQQFGTS